MNLTRAIVTQEKPVILFLQGPPTGFWPRLSDAFAARGCDVLRVNLCAADALFWRRDGAINYRGTLAEWPTWLRTRRTELDHTPHESSGAQHLMSHHSPVTVRRCPLL